MSTFSWKKWFLLASLIPDTLVAHSDSRSLELRRSVPGKKWREDKTAHQEATESTGFKPGSFWSAVREALGKGMSFPLWYFAWSCK